MTLEQQVCSLDLAKRLKELGVKQESYVYWIMNWDSDYPEEGHWWSLAQKHELITGREQYSAFTVAELGEMLPYSGDVSYPTGYLHTVKIDQNNYRSCYANGAGVMGYKGELLQQVANTEANARAKMLIYLLENKLIN